MTIWSGLFQLAIWTTSARRPGPGGLGQRLVGHAEDGGHGARRRRGRRPACSVPRLWTRRTASSKPSAPAATRAEYSPRLWPAATAGSRPSSAVGDRADDEQGRLGVPGQPQLLLGAFEAQARERKAEDLVGRVEEALGLLGVVVEALAHADGLGSLAREIKKRIFSWPSPVAALFQTVGPDLHLGLLPQGVDPGRRLGLDLGLLDLGLDGVQDLDQRPGGAGLGLAGGDVGVGVVGLDLAQADADGPLEAIVEDPSEEDPAPRYRAGRRPRSCPAGSSAAGPRPGRSRADSRLHSASTSAGSGAEAAGRTWSRTSF